MRAMPFRTRERPRGDDPPLEFASKMRSGALRSLDRALREFEGRSRVSCAEVVDLLLDLRSAIVLDTALEELSDELQVR